jgi:H+/Cl- antiporter ClcA
VSSGLAGLIMKVLLHDPRIYELAPFTLGASLLVWSVVAGPIFGVAAIAFRHVAERARAHAPSGAGRIAWCVPTFLGIGVLAIGYPQILGNGKSAAQIGLAGDVTIRLAAVLLLLRFIVTTGSVRAGAKGGLLTPSLALGALLGAMLGGLWNFAWPGTAMSAFALVGATAFLATSQRMPITAVVLIAEFARIDQDMLFALLLAVGAAVAVQAAMGSASKAR